MSKNEQYFSKFPTVPYNGQTVTDISRRAKLSNSLRSIPTAFYPWQIDHDTRCDVLAHQYYGDSSLHWLINITNGIVDPYYGWHLTDEQLTSHVVDKYGSVEDAQRRISHWGTNWFDSDINISVTYYQNSLPEAVKKYYVPNFGPGTKILSYGRREEDWIVATNRIIQIFPTTPGQWVVGDLINSLDAPQGHVIGSGEVETVLTDSLYVKDVQNGSWNTGGYIGTRGFERTDSLTAPSVLIFQAISDIDAPYWSPVSYYDMETDTNDSNSTILLLDRNYVNDAGETLAKQLRSDTV